MPPEPTRTERPTCRRCHRPKSVCYCAAITTIETKTRIVILQHPKERGMPIGTARMAHLCLPSSSLHVGLTWDGTDVLREASSDPERPPILLYPGEGAKDILEEPPEGPVTLIVIDGTWSQARNLVRDNPELARLPQYQFQAPQPSNYRIRREPCESYVSTLEALMHVLGALEGDATRFQALMQPMNAMVDAQIAAHAAETHPRKTPQRKRRSQYERLPESVREHLGDMVLVYADANAWPYASENHELGDELIHWVALRPSTGASFTYTLAPRLPLAPATPERTELTHEALLSGGTVEGFLDAWSSFLGPGDAVASWGHHAVRLLQDAGGAIAGPYLDLRRAARLAGNAKPGTLEMYLDRVLPDAVAKPAASRAARRLGMLHTLTEHWRGWRDVPLGAPTPPAEESPDARD